MTYEKKTARKPKNKKQKPDPERDYSTPVPGHPMWADIWKNDPKRNV